MSTAVLAACVTPTDERLGETEDELAQALVREKEPNDSAATATPIAGSSVERGSIFPNGDVDYYSFTAAAGDRVYAATMTSYSSNGTTDSTLDLLASDGTTVIESDNDDGSLGPSASSIAGAVIPAAGTYYARVRSAATSQLRPYDLHFGVKSGAPTPETEPNEPASPQALPASAWVSGSLSSATDVDVFSLSLNAGDSVFASLDLDPERDGVEWNGALGIALFNNQTLLVNDAGAAGADSEAHFITVKDTGTYYVAVAAGAATFGTYQLAVTVHPAAQASCTTYTSADVPKAIPTGPGQVLSTITIPGNPRVGRMEVAVNLNHTNMPDLDIHLKSPAGNDNCLFTDIGNNVETAMDLAVADDAASPLGVFNVVKGMTYLPERDFSLGWLDGEDAGGTWTLVLDDDLTANGGTLNGWSITVCTPPPPPACAAGSYPFTVFATDFEADAAGFTHSGTADEWARGAPNSGTITACNSGTSCFKTDLTGPYEFNSSQDLLSPAIDLTFVSGPVVASWAQKYQVESASFDHISVDIVPAGGGAAKRLFEHQSAGTNTTIGSPSVTLAQSAGWGVRTADVSSFAGASAQLKFHLDSDNTVNYPGLAIDDVKVTACKVNTCGDGFAFGAEGCDDGNAISGDGCDANCTVTACGNGIKAGAEGCDDGNVTSGDGCDANCTVTACGNGVMTGTEACDDGNLTSGDGCDANCTVTACGNAILTGTEVCDDGNVTSGDGCDSNCTVTACGNGVMTGTEACDDGNAVDGDGCDSNCTMTACGNGVLTGTEVCDDGNAVDDDGCDSNCTVTACGNGVLTGAEVCDDGNVVDDDGCDSNCTVTACGNGILTGTEVCDDGNVVEDDGCDSNCTVTACGNGIKTDTEGCDDGNLVDDDGCDSNCVPTGCGNGVKTDTEGCDDGNVLDDDGCDSNCTVTACGNAIKAGDEGCDDGNAVDGDGCDSNCTVTACGNGIQTGTEGCDDGNVVAGDGCDASCAVEGTGTGGTTTTGAGAAGGAGGAGGSGGAATTGSGGSDTSPEGGCGCSVPGNDSGATPWASALALLGLVGLGRRRASRRA